MTIKKALLTMAIASLASGAQAVTDGDGALDDENSSVTIDVTLEVKDMIQITSKSDGTQFAFDDYVYTMVNDGDGGDAIELIAFESFCVFVNGGGGYNVTMSDSGSTTGFFLNSAGASDEIPFQVTYAAAAKDAVRGDLTAPGTAVTESTAITGLAGHSSQYCDAADNLSIAIDITEDDLLDADTGDYDTTMTFLVAVE